MVSKAVLGSKICGAHTQSTDTCACTLLERRLLPHVFAFCACRTGQRTGTWAPMAAMMQLAWLACSAPLSTTSMQLLRVGGRQQSALLLAGRVAERHHRSWLQLARLHPAQPAVSRACHCLQGHCCLLRRA